MDDSNNVHEMLETAGQILIRCFVLGIFVLFFWWGMLLGLGDLAYSVHTKMVPISRQQFYVIHYAGMLITKATISVLFLFPYIAIRLVVRNRKR